MSPSQRFVVTRARDDWVVYAHGMLTSIPFGPFDPAHPGCIPGCFAANILTEPIDIDAPVAVVWEIMVDFERYPEWNPLNRFFRLDTYAEPGQTVTFGPRWGPYDSDRLGEAGFTQHETLTVWEENCCLAYATISSLGQRRAHPIPCAASQSNPLLHLRAHRRHPCPRRAPRLRPSHRRRLHRQRPGAEAARRSALRTSERDCCINSSVDVACYLRSSTS